MHIQPYIGKLERQYAAKHAIEMVICRMADAGLGEQTVRVALCPMNECLFEAEENNYIAKNPARKSSRDVHTRRKPAPWTSRRPGG